MVDPDSDKISRVSSYSGTSRESIQFHLRDFHPLWWQLSRCLLLSVRFLTPCRKALQPHAHRNAVVWALPRSLAATQGISIDFFSCRYLDGSVPYVSLYTTIYSSHSNRYSNLLGYPIRLSRDHYVFATPPGFSQLTAAFFAGQRQRHPPWTLSRLTIFLFTPSLIMSNNNFLEA